MIIKKERLNYSRSAGIERLRQFEKEVLEKIPALRFSIQVFVDEDSVLKDPEGISSLEEYWNDECGTVACAMGWAAMYPPFTELGFKLTRDEEGRLLGGVEFWDGRVGIKRCGMEAVETFFSLSLEEASYLFHGLSYTEKKDEEVDLGEVRERIREFLEKESLPG
jgi:hypothetical protein